MKPFRRTMGVVLASCFGVFVASWVLAGGPYTDDLSRCLVKSTTDTDRTLLVRWIFAMATLHPAVKSMATIPENQRTELNRKTAELMERLLTVSCQSDAQQALKFEGNSAIEASFNVLGQVAGRELFSDPQVATGMAGLNEYLDGEKLKKALLPGK